MPQDTTVHQATTAPIAADESENVEPEFVGQSNFTRRTDLGRTTFYMGCRLGWWKSISLRKPGSIKGRRLAHWPSVKAYLHGQAEAK